MAKTRLGPEGELYQHVGGELRRLRLKANLKQEELAIRIGVSRASIANVEAGKQAIPLHLLVAIARTLETNLDALLPTAKAKIRPRKMPSEAPEVVLSFVRELSAR